MAQTITRTPEKTMFIEFGTAYTPTGAVDVAYNPDKAMINLGKGYSEVIRNTNPDWQQRLAKRQNVASPYKREGYTVRPVGGFASCEFTEIFYGRPMHGTIQSCSLYAFPSLDMIRNATVSDRALASLKRKLANKVGDMQLMAPVAELRELRSTIVGTAHMATDLLKSLIDIKRTKGKSAAKYASDAWLNFGFGISPMIGDAKKLAQSIQAYLDRKDRTERLIGGNEVTWQTHGNVDGSFGFLTLRRKTDYQITHSYSVRYIAGFELLLKSANDYGIFDHLGFDFGAIIPTMWELTPWSWVLDYFTTAGAFLDDVFVSDPSRFLYGVMCERYTADVVGSYRVVGNGTSSKSFNEEPLYFNASYFNFQRSALTSLPNRSLRFKTADEIGKNAVNKLLNLGGVLMAGTNYSAYRSSLHGMRGELYSSQYGKQHI